MLPCLRNASILYTLADMEYDVFVVLYPDVPLVLTLKRSSHSTKRMVVRINMRCTLEMVAVRVLSLHVTYMV